MSAKFSFPVFLDTCNHYIHKNLKLDKKTTDIITTKDPVDMEMKHHSAYNVKEHGSSSMIHDDTIHHVQSIPWESVKSDTRVDPYLCDFDIELCNRSNYVDMYNPNSSSDYNKLSSNTSVEYKQYLVPPQPQECTQRRTSLHGKTITVRISRNETRYRKLQAKIYNFLERPKTWPSVIYHVIVFASVFGCLVLSVLSTIHEYTESAGRILLYMELVILFWFFAEYCLRLWSAGCRSRYQTWRGRLNFARRPFCIVDVIVIVASVIVLAVDSDRNMFAASALRGLRFFQILRMIRMDRRGGSFKLLASVVWAHRQELFTTVYIGFLGLIFSSFLIFLVEKKENEKIRTYADALWWGVITLCTVGYGDSVPQSGLGKTIAGCSCLAIISFYALPPGILGSGFALKVQQHQRQKHLIRRRVPAATLIQCLWRCYAADPHSSSAATWKIHMRPLRKPVGLTNSYSMIERSGFSRFSRFSTLKRRSDKIHSGTNTGVNNTAPTVSSDETNTDLPRSAPAKPEGLDAMYTFISDEDAAKLKHIQQALDHEKPHSPDGKLEKESDEMLATFSQAQIGNIQANVIDPLSSGDREYISLSKQRRQLTTNGQNYANQPMLQQESVLCTSRGSEVIMHPLTEKEKVAVRVIRKLRFFVARRKFREALRPYDVKDVIEQYSAGHVDMLARVKTLQARLDQILGRPGSKNDDVYDSHLCLASRIVKIEHKIDTVEMKLDRLINLYKADRFIKYHGQMGNTGVVGKRLLRSGEKNVQEKYVQYSDTQDKPYHEQKSLMTSTTGQKVQLLEDDDGYTIRDKPYIRFANQRLPKSERNSRIVSSPLALTNERWRSFEYETPNTSAYHYSEPMSKEYQHPMSLKPHFSCSSDKLPPTYNKHTYPLQSTSSGNLIPSGRVMSTFSESCLGAVVDDDGDNDDDRPKLQEINKQYHPQQSVDELYLDDLLNTCNLTESVNLIKIPDPYASPSKSCLRRQDEVVSPVDCQFIDDDEKKSLISSSDNVVVDSVKSPQDDNDDDDNERAIRKSI
uniref:Ion_trans domain-containing protein n=1 Tax=Trichobilharzia regenti TaxID=157069 RepID=A0AA85JRG5_TRIRE|nr:unnamed protein product [Trichobilharzia regenti]